MESQNAAIGARIRAMRAHKKMTQKKLGEAIGRTESSIAQYEKGNVEIPLNVLQKLAAALGVEIGELISLEEVQQASRDHTKRMAEAWDEYRRDAAKDIDRRGNLIGAEINPELYQLAYPELVKVQDAIDVIKAELGEAIRKKVDAETVKED